MSKKKPNVITIFADDLGIGDVSAFNPDSKIKTENIDRLARRGMRFYDSHATSSICSPSRYGLLTGRYNWRSNLKSYVLPGDSKSLIPEGRRTIAHMLKDQGYRTDAVGKWHLGLKWQRKKFNDYEAYGLDPEDFEERDYIVGRDGAFDWSAKKETELGTAPFEGLDIDFSEPITFGPNQSCAVLCMGSESC
ncbi:sulfatase-like hydrolase/transferase [Atopococcus tabaci]|uniref:sulfatase-like hydrolase/transferase n=1 Tax=Atopococcus tabaci TaxID=269774 RepID=UPI0024096B1A|nr:sulfatase-like hydrolase/transferase [Atopococcus tabaci]